MNAILLRRRKLGRTSCREIAAKMQGYARVVRNWVAQDVPANLNTSGFVFRWGCTSLLPAVYANCTVVNTAKSISWCADKKQGRLDMQAAGVPVPETWDLDEFVEEDRDDQLYVVRPPQHAQGRNLLALTNDEIMSTNFPAVYSGGYVSEFIDKEHEYRVFVCQNRAVWVAKKTPGNPEQVAWNVAQGGRFDNVRWGDWPLNVVRAALAAAKVSGTDFSGVDVMMDAEGQAYVLEVNSAPSQTSPYRQGCVAKAFSYIVANGKEHFPDVTEDVPTWKSYIHPALVGVE